MMPPVGVLVMAYGTASDPDDIERYYTDIRGGRPPSQDHLESLRARYAAIGNRFPLLDITREQAAGLERELRARQAGAYRTYLGMKHSLPFVEEGVARMREDGVERAVGIVMAPLWSEMSVESYVLRAEAAANGSPAFTFVRQWYDHPAFVDLLASRVSDALARLSPSERSGAAVVFSAHSLPVRTLDDGAERCLRCDACTDSCRYRDQLLHAADLVAGRVQNIAHAIGWQSAGRTADPWCGPSIESVIRGLAQDGATLIVSCAAGFVADNLEILYDLDIQAKRVAVEAGIRLVRTEMPNADPRFAKALAAVVVDHLAEVHAR